MRRRLFVMVMLMLTLTMSAFLIYLSARAAALDNLVIVYPGEGDKLPFLSRSFIFGSVEPGSSVAVNGQRALVAPSGGWIAYVPFTPGTFVLHVVAHHGAQTESVQRSVIVAQAMRTLPASPAKIDETPAPEPAEDVTLQPGDVLHLFVKASHAARVTAALGATSLSLSEATTSSLQPTEKERILGDAVASGEPVAGLYAGEMRVAANAPEESKVTYTVTSSDGSTSQAMSHGSVHVIPLGSCRRARVVLVDRSKDIDARPYGIVESQPDGGWLFFPPAGTPFGVTGSDGNYDRVALGSREQGWMLKTSLQLAPQGTACPQTSVQGVEVRDGTRHSTVIVHLHGRSPFWITSQTGPARLHIRFFNAAAATDFVRYGNDKSNIDEIRWDQQADNIATMDIMLRQRDLFGYHAAWQGDDLTITIKKPPDFAQAPASALRGLLVVIDPGHSPDTGAIGPLGTRERDINLAIAKRLADRLGKFGARTALTRTSNVPVGLYARTDMAARLGADVLISVHNNALPDGVDPFTHHGFSVYYYQPQSLGLARAIHAAYARDTSLPDYGLYYDNLALVRPTEEPAVLTESAFVMWPPEEALLRDSQFQGKLAVTIADGLERWASTMRARNARS